MENLEIAFFSFVLPLDLWGGVCKDINEETPQSERVGYGIFDAMCWRSIDGGRNWTSQKLTDGALQELVVKDNIVYAVVNPKSNKWGYETFIYESRNFGADWTFKCGIKGSMVRLHVRDSNWMIGYIGYNRFYDTEECTGNNECDNGVLHLFEIDILTYLDINLTTKNYESIAGIVCYFSVCEL